MPSIVSALADNILDRAILDDTLVTSITSLDVGLDALVLAEGGRGRSGGLGGRHFGLRGLGDLEFGEGRWCKWSWDLESEDGSR